MNVYTDRRGTEVNARSPLGAARQFYDRTAQLEGADMVGEDVAIWTVTSSSRIPGENQSCRWVLGELYGRVSAS